MRRFAPLLCLLLFACGPDDATATSQGEANEAVTQTEKPKNTQAQSLFPNGNFSKGNLNWFTYQYKNRGGFRVVRDGPGDGTYPSGPAGRLTLEPGPAKPGFRVATMEIEDKQLLELPKRLRGRYFVETWEPGIAMPWIEVGVVAFGPDTRPMTPPAYAKYVTLVLAGRDQEKIQTRTYFDLGNEVKIIPKDAEGKPTVKLGTDVETGRWIEFEFDVEDAFREHWGVMSNSCNGVRVFGKIVVGDYIPEEKGEFKAVVYFDDIYAGD